VTTPVLVVVETADNAYVGTTVIDNDTNTLFIHTGFAGHPVALPLEEVESITPASRHPLVESVP
jgi:hypothetical protein